MGTLFVFCLSADILQRAVSVMQSVSGRKSISEVTQYLFFTIEGKNVTLRATDLEVYFSIPFVLTSIEREESVSFGVPLKKLFEMIKDCHSSTIECSYSEEEHLFNLSFGTAKVSLPTIAYDTVVEQEELLENRMAIPYHIIGDVWSQFVTAAGMVQHPESLFTGIGFEVKQRSILLTSTDGYCLAHVATSFEGPIVEEAISVVFSKRSFGEMVKTVKLMGSRGENILVGSAGSFIVFSGNNFSLSLRALNEKMPQYDKIIDRNGLIKKEIDLPSFSIALRRASAIASDKFIPASLAFSSETPHIAISINAGLGGAFHDKVSAKSDMAHESFSFSAYPPYLLNGLFFSLKQDEKGDGEKKERPYLYVSPLLKRRPIIFYSQRSIESVCVEQFFAVMPMIATS